MKTKLLILLLLCGTILSSLSGFSAMGEGSLERICFYTPVEEYRVIDSMAELEEAVLYMQENNFANYEHVNILIWLKSNLPHREGESYLPWYEQAKDALSQIESISMMPSKYSPTVEIHVDYEKLNAEAFAAVAESNFVSGIYISDQLVASSGDEDEPTDGAAESGDGAVYGVTVLGVAAAALTVLLLRKKKI